ncbi:MULTISPECIES: phage major tail tube protein [unclassified Campylobacter]|uniref:phage major tail tube protein n=1 Tax=unclassified Campylobacter TaxID=2593542 RepID=UPI003D349C4E
MPALTAQAITGGNLFVDGIGKLGELKSAELPKFEFETLETGTAIGKYELVLPTLKPLTCTLEVNNVNMLYFATLNTNIPQVFYIKKNLTAQHGEHTKITATFTGNVKVLETPKFEMNAEAVLKLEIACTFVKYDINDAPAVIYDVKNAIHMVGGVDLYEKIRKNIL